jgi:hypothetical protein
MGWERTLFSLGAEAEQGARAQVHVRDLFDEVIGILAGKVRHSGQLGYAFVAVANGARAHRHRKTGAILDGPARGRGRHGEDERRPRGRSHGLGTPRVVEYSK